MKKQITPKPLTQEAFAPYGDVIEAGSTEVRTINEGNTQRFHNLAKLDLIQDQGCASINIFRSTPLELPITIKLMERHPKSSQAFFPVSDNPYLVIVAPPGELDPSKIEVFLAAGHQGVNYHRGTWHHYSLALGSRSDFLVVDRIAEDENCDEMLLSENDQFIITELT